MRTNIGNAQARIVDPEQTLEEHVPEKLRLSEGVLA
jgi:hypothetical protein